MEFRLLGAVDAEIGGRPVFGGLRRRERCLLAVLLLEAGRVIPAGRLAELLWDGEPGERAQGALQVHISRVRNHIAALGPAAAGLELRTRGTGYVLEVDPETVDAHRFRRLVAAARDSTTDPARLELLDTALALWRGPALADVASDWLRDRICAGLNDLRLHALEERAETLLRLGHHHRALAELADAIRAHPVAERLVGLQMRALYLAGRRTDALAAFQELRERLADEHGLDPQPELVALHTAILRDDPGLRPIPPTRKPTFGGHAAWPSPALLPADVAHFTGRDHDGRGLRAYVEQMTGQQAAAVVVVTGTAGVGKTAFAVHWAHRLRDRFPDGQLYVNLRGFAPGAQLRPIDALTRFLRALGVPAGAVPVEEEAAADLYRSLLAERKVLVLLDNARDAAQVRPLLPGGSACLALVTSRNRLGGLVARQGAQRLTLGVLAPEESRALLSRMVGEVAGDEPEAVAALATACAHLPLALRIAAANIADEPERSVTDHLRAMARDRMAALTAEAGDEEAAVTAAFDLSYRALPDPVRRVFTFLGLHPGDDPGVAAAAALSGVSADEAAVALEALANAHLVERVAPGRYAFHDLLRAYARHRAEELFSPDHRERAIDDLLSWYLGSVDAAARSAYPERVRLPGRRRGPAPAEFTGAGPAQAWLDLERANLVAAVEYAATSGSPSIAWLLADSLVAYFNMRSELREWLTVGEAGMAAAEAADDTVGRAAMNACLGGAYLRIGDVDRAQKRYTDARDLASQAGWAAGEASALNQLGATYRDQGDPGRSVSCYERALELYDGGHPGTEALFVSNIGLAYLGIGRLVAGAEHLDRAVRLFREAAGPVAVARSLNALGFAQHSLGNLDEAMARLNESLALHQQHGFAVGEAGVLQCIADVHHDAGRFDEALRVARTALALHIDHEGPQGEVLSRITIAACLVAMGASRRAVDELIEARERARAIGYSLGEASIQVRLASTRCALGDFAAAAADAARARDLTQRGSMIVIGVDADLAHAEATAGLGRRDEAMTGYRSAAERAHEMGYASGAVRGLTGLARVGLDLGQVPQARAWAGEAVAVARRCGFVALAEEAQAVLSRAVDGSR